MEWKKLSQLTGNPEYNEAAQRAMDAVLQSPQMRKNEKLSTKGTTRHRGGDEENGDPDLILSELNYKGESVSGWFTLGSKGDSFPELLLKQWLLTNRTDRFP